MDEKNEVAITENIGQAAEVVFSFDTTGSMQGVIKAVRENIEKTCEELFEANPGLKIGMIAHGDYGDGDNTIMSLDLTNDRKEIFRFIRGAPNTSGGDAPECYELALNRANSMSWGKDTIGKVLIMIGDEAPHEADFPANKDKIDWRKELAALKEKGVNVYSLQCLYHEGYERNEFWKTISETFSTPLLKMNDFSGSTDVFKAAVASAGGEEAFASYNAKLAESELGGEALCNIRAFAGEAKKYNKKM